VGKLRICVADEHHDRVGSVLQIVRFFSAWPSGRMHSSLHNGILVMAPHSSAPSPAATRIELAQRTNLEALE
jgi:hypothetical protein